MITGKTIGQLDLISPPTDNLSIPVDNNGSTSRILFSGITNKITSQGLGTVASGIFSHSEGNVTFAVGDYSHAEGMGSISVGEASHAEGNQSSSSGSYSHSEGQTTVSDGIASHAEGNSTTSTGDFSHSEGLSTTSYGTGSHAEGNSTNSMSYYSHTEGYDTIGGWNGYNVVSTNYNVVSIDSNGEDLTNLFTSDKIIMDNKIYNYSSVNFNNPYFDITLTEPLTFANFYNLTYSPIDTTGFVSIYSNGDDIFVQVPLPSGITQDFLSVTYDTVYVSSNGYVTFSGGSSSCCFNPPSGIPSSVGLPGLFLGILGMDGLLYDLYTGTTNTGTTFVVRFEGSYRLLSNPSPDLIFNLLFYPGGVSYFDIVIESNTQIEFTSGVSDGISPSYLGTFSPTSGTAYRVSTGTLLGFFANDLDNLSNSDAPIINSNFAHAEGFSSKALGRASHSEGGYNISVGQYSNAKGYFTTSLGEGSNSSGIGTIATSDYQTATGSYNTSGNTTSLFVVGNGTGDTARSDIFLVNPDEVIVEGDLVVEGVVKIPNIMEYSDNADALANGLIVGDVYRTGDLLKIVH